MTSRATLAGSGCVALESSHRCLRVREDGEAFALVVSGGQVMYSLHDGNEFGVIGLLPSPR